MDFNNLEELKAKLTEISKSGFIKSHRLNNTGIEPCTMVNRISVQHRFLHKNENQFQS
jgi:hypothetical protein